MENILQVIQENTTKQTGISMVQLAVKTGVSITYLKQALNELHRAGQIRVREGINDKLIFLV